MSMVGKVARAIWLASTSDGYSNASGMLVTPAYYVDEARAAIAAMREPTMEMVDAGDIALDDCKDSGWDSGGDGEGCNSYEYIISGSQTTIYQAMIDAALKEPVSPSPPQERQSDPATPS
jgi:hypothetical protein